MTMMASSSFVSVSDNVSIDSEVASVMFQTGAMENSGLDMSANSDFPVHWDRAGESRHIENSSTSTSLDCSDRTVDTVILTRKPRRVTNALWVFMVLVLLAGIAYHLMESEMLFGENVTFVSLFGLAGKKGPGGDRVYRQILEVDDISNQGEGSHLQAGNFLGEGRNNFAGVTHDARIKGRADFSDRVMISRKQRIDAP